MSVVKLRESAMQSTALRHLQTELLYMLEVLAANCAAAQAQFSDIGLLPCLMDIITYQPPEALSAAAASAATVRGSIRSISGAGAAAGWGAACAASSASAAAAAAAQSMPMHAADKLQALRIMHASLKRNASSIALLRKRGLFPALSLLLLQAAAVPTLDAPPPGALPVRITPLDMRHMSSSRKAMGTYQVTLDLDVYNTLVQTCSAPTAACFEYRTTANYSTSKDNFISVYN